MSENTGACYEIAIDGTMRSHCDRKDMALEAARRLKTKEPYSDVTVRDLETGETISINHPLQK